MTDKVSTAGVDTSAWPSVLLMPENLRVRWICLLRPYGAAQTAIGVTGGGDWIAVGGGEARRLTKWSSAMLAVLSYPKHSASTEIAIASAHAGLNPKAVTEKFPWGPVIKTGLESSDEQWVDRALEWIERSVRDEDVLVLLAELARGERSYLSGQVRQWARERVDVVAEEIVREAAQALRGTRMAQVELQHLTSGARGHAERDFVLLPYGGPKANEVHVVEVLNLLPSGGTEHVRHVLEARAEKVKRANPYVVHVGVLIVVGLRSADRKAFADSRHFMLLHASPAGKSLADEILSWLGGR